MSYQVGIIGAGPSGYTAAIYASRANLNTVLFTGLEPGGQLMLTSDVENWPGEEHGILGPELMAKLRTQAGRFGAEIKELSVTAVDLISHPKKLTLSNGTVAECESVIIATGASAKWLDVPGESKLLGRGVSACATCDGFFFKGKNVAVVGGGDSAMEEANFLTKFASRVTVIHRSAEFKASKIMLTRAQNNPKISFKMNAKVVEVLGEDRVTGLKIENLIDQTSADLPFDGLFVAIGHFPNSAIFANQLTVDRKGYITVLAGTTQTNIPGVFAAGDVVDHLYRQAVTAAGTGCIAALEAERWISHGA